MWRRATADDARRLSARDPARYDAGMGFFDDVRPLAFGQLPAKAVDMLGQPVSVTPYPILTGIWTYGIPDHLWRVTNANGGDGTATSVDGALHVTSGTVNGGITRIESKDHPRYRPDQMWGLMTATNGFPIGSRLTVRVGQFTTWNGFYLSVDCATGVATFYTRRTTGVVAPAAPNYHDSGLGAATITSTPAFVAQLPPGADLSLATLLDMIMLWRGVADQKLLVNLIESGSTSRLGSAGDFWASNPALPFAVEVERHTPGDNDAVEFGCAKIATFGPVDQVYDYKPFESGTIALDNTERPLVVAQAAGFLGGMPCTRDHVIKAVGSVQVDAAATVRIYHNANVTSLGTGAWSIPDPTRGLVWGVGSITATVNVATAELFVSRTFAAGEKYDFDDLYFNQHPVRPIPGTLTTGANRGNPAFGETFVVTIQKTVGGGVNASATPVIGSLY